MVDPRIQEEIDKLNYKEIALLLSDIEGYKQPLVDINQFIEDPDYLGSMFLVDGKMKLFSIWVEALNTIFPNPYESDYYEVAFSGSIGAGKCFHKDTKVTTSIGTLSLEDLYTLKKRGYSFDTLSEDGCFHNVSDVFYNGERPTLLIKTARGKCLRPTSKHKFRVVEDGYVVWKQACELQVGSLLCRVEEEDISYNPYTSERESSYLYLNALGAATDVIISVELGEYTQTYDLQVEGSHTYLVEGIVTHNSTCGRIVLLYDLYKLLMLRDPFLKYSLIASDAIVLALFTANLNLARTVLYKPFRELVRSSPVLRNELLDPKKESGAIEFPHNILIQAGSRFTHALGMAVFCLHGDTRIPMLDGRVLPIKEITDEFEQSKEDLYVYSLDTQTKSIVPGKITNAVNNGKSHVFRVVLDNETYLDATANHPILMRDNKYKKVADLKKGDRIMPYRLYTDDKGYYRVVNPYDGEDRHVHRIMFEYKNGRIPEGHTIHHKDFKKSGNKLNNKLNNLVSMPSPCFLESVQRNLAKASDWVYSEENKVHIKEAAEKFRLDPSGEVPKFKDTWVKWFESEEEYAQLVKSHNHEIVDIQYLGEFDVFDLTIDKFHNFALECGAVVHNSGMLDEASFQQESENTHQAYDSYISMSRRMKSRFMAAGGVIPGHLVLISSKTDDNAFLEKHIEDSKNDPHFICFDFPIWEAHKDKGIYCGERFKVFSGTALQSPKILEDGDPLDKYPADKILDVPVEYRKEFTSNITKALMDLAGSTTVSMSKYIVFPEELRKAVRLVHCCNVADHIMLDFHDDTRLIEFVDVPKLMLYLNLLQSSPRYVHIDIGVTHDSFGFAMSTVSGMRDVEKFELDEIIQNSSSTGLVMRSEPVIRTELALSIRSVNRVPLWKIRDFIMDLSELGFPIVKITADTFQSEDTLQLLAKAGYETGILSMDRSKEPHITFRNALYEGRVELPDNPILITEFTELVDKGKKFDHNTENTKDISDAVVGSHYIAFRDSGSFIDLL